jgi:lipopolysaccharide/colanic/teichoic acid biosynthesis glycosyltransferase
MQAEKIDIVPHLESPRSYLRVATITHEQSCLSFLYVGNNETSIKLLLGSGNSGLIAENIAEAQKLIETEDFSEKGLDVIILDIAYSELEIKTFEAFLKNTTKVAKDTPVLYNQMHLKNIHQGVHEVIDDVINLSNWQFDFEAKVKFLKKSKQFIQPVYKESSKIKAKSCLYKRAFDITVALFLLLLALPLFIIIAIAIRLESKGPIFYNARRAGKGFKIFKFYKFRTMVVNADKKIEALAHLNQYSQSGNKANFFKIANDPRITKVGRFLRNTSLDELPQLFNVLKGDMSLVGNRPLPLYEAATLTTNDFVERFMAPAGITGLWQIKKRGKSDMSVEERIMLDISYARKSTLLYDLWIMANTPGALIQKSDV